MVMEPLQQLVNLFDVRRDEIEVSPREKFVEQSKIADVDYQLLTAILRVPANVVKRLGTSNRPARGHV